MEDSATIVGDKFIIDGSWQEEIGAVVYDIAGKPIKNFIREEVLESSTVSEGATFSDDAKAFVFNWKSSFDSYRIWPSTWNQDCNYDDVNAATVADLTAACAPGYSQSSLDEFIVNDIPADYDRGLILLANGKAVFHGGYDKQSAEIIRTETTWQRKDVDGQDMILYKIPANVMSGEVDSDITHGFYVKIAGAIYSGFFSPQDAVGGEDFYDFNMIAIEDIKQHLTFN